METRGPHLRIYTSPLTANHLKGLLHALSAHNTPSNWHLQPLPEPRHPLPPMRAIKRILRPPRDVPCVKRHIRNDPPPHGLHASQQPGTDTTAEKATDRLFILPPKASSPHSREILYLLAWRYILTECYRIHYDNIKFNSDQVIRRMIERYTTLCKAALYGNNTDASRRAKADMGRQPKKRIDVNELRPIFETNDDTFRMPKMRQATALTTECPNWHAAPNPTRRPARSRPN